MARSLTSVALDLVVAELVVNHATESNGVTEELQTGDVGAPDHHGGADKHDILQHTAEGKDDSRSLANQEDDGDVEHESAETVEEEGEETDVVDISHAALGDFPDESNDTVHDGADGGEVVQRDEGVHLQVGRAEQTLNHGKTEGLEHDTGELEQDTNDDKVNLANGGNDDTDDNGGDVEELLHVGGRDTQGPGSQQDSDGSGGLEHLDESDGEVEVGQVTADQTQAEEDTDRNDSAQVNAASHLDRLATIKHCSPSCHTLGDDRRKRQVVGGKDNGVP